jgi:hypothetical protein
MIRRVLALVISLVLVFPALAPAEETSTVTGPVLISQLPLDATLVENTVTEDGGYTERLLTSDTYADIALMRRTGAVAADALLAELYPEAADVAEIEQAPIAAYPAVRYSFTTGANEDTRFGTLVVFSTDTDTFAFAVDVWADASEDYADLIEWWIESLDLFDDSDSAAAPTGLVLTADIPEDAEIIGVGMTENGDYTQRYLVSGTAEVTMLRRAEALSAQDLLMELYPDAQVAFEEEAAPVASYPTARLNFTDGENEDARFGSLILISTDTATFAFIATAPLDQWDGDYSETVQIWIDSLGIVED